MEASRSASGGSLPPRLMITKMVLENFKSYAGIQEIGPFHKCFSSVVGPNGSGKSNVIDAMLFVFGKRATQIRLKKVSELIHRSERFPDLREARVSVHFQDIIDTSDAPDGYTVVPGSQFVVTRTANRSNDSAYFLDGRKVTMNEVTTLLKAKGIDLDFNRFLILQGEVEQIAMMKPKGQDKGEDGLLEYIEELIGSNRLKEPIEESYKDLEKLNEERQEKLNRTAIADKAKEELSGQRQAAQAFLDLERQLLVERSVLFQLHQRDLKKSMLELEAKKKQFEEKRAYESKKLEESEGKMKEFDGKYKGMKDSYDTLNKEVDKAQSEFAVFERKDTKLREDAKFAKQKEKKFAENIKKEEIKASDAKRDAAMSVEEEEKAQQVIGQLKPQLEKEEADVERMMQSIQGEIEPLRAEMEEKNRKLLPISEQVTQGRQHVASLQAEKEVIESKYNKLKRSMEEAEKRVEDAATGLTQRTKDKKELDAKLQAGGKKMKQLQTELTQVTKKEAEASNTARSLRSRIEDAKAAETNAKSRGAVLTGLLRCKAAGTIKGIHNRLGDLGTIDAKFDVAISTACGGFLDYLVVETTETGNACIQYLKDNGLGRANFIVLDKMDKARQSLAQPPKAYPEDAKRLIDLVNVSDERFKPALYFALRDTLVAKDLTQARRIAFESSGTRHRVVTLDGAVIEPSGTLSGGGQTASRGGMSVAAVASSGRGKGAAAAASSAAGANSDMLSPQEIAKLETECKNQSDLAQELKKRRIELEAEIRALEQEIAKVSTEISKVDLDLRALENQRSDAQQTIERLRPQLNKKSSEDSSRLQALEAESEATRRQFAETEAQAAALQTQIDELQRKIADAGGVRLKTAKYKVDRMTKEIREAETSITQQQVKRNTLEKAAVKALKAAEKMKEEADENAASLEKVKKEITELEELALQVKKKHDAAKDALKKKADELDGMREEYDRLQKVVATVRSVDLDIQTQLDEITKAMKDDQAKLTYFGKELKKTLKESQEAAAIDATSSAASSSSAAASSSSSSSEPQQPQKNLDAKELNAEELEQHQVDRVKATIMLLEDKLKAERPDMSVIQEYRKREADYLSRVAELDEVTQRKNESQRKYDDLRKQRLDEFMTGFSIITLKLKEMYQMITLGGDAELELVDSVDPFREGIVFSVRPPRKSWKNIQNLSGGEKTLSSLALVFALHHYKPTPLYVMDEIDAALDFKNVSIVANYIKERTKNAQFVIISLRNNMFELADRLVGIYKTENCTKSVTIDPAAFAGVAGPSSSAASSSSGSEPSASARGKRSVPVEAHE